MATPKQKIDRGFRVGMMRKIIGEGLERKFWFYLPINSRRLLADCKYFPDELYDLIVLAQPQGFDAVVKLIDDWLHLESKVTESERMYYKAGYAKDLFEKIKEQRNLYLNENNLNLIYYLRKLIKWKF